MTCGHAKRETPVDSYEQQGESELSNLGGLIAGYGIWCNSKYQSQDCAYEARELSLESPFIEINY
ncbi:hypothetical protein VP01_5339g1 [Puccinia sorghi]|uniref:Uncharacterized protein n=1 Tax=Puccinia sorghi TaxID=27349 RepID=A0A0L6UK48_9BASI|nr:hypothetical protein VP01_5339g1 [Puccinia sorghi]